MPELELGEPADEGPELVVLLGGEAGRAGITVLQAFVLGQGGVELGLQEEKEEVQEVDSEGVGDYSGGGVSSVCRSVCLSVGASSCLSGVSGFWFLGLTYRCTIPERGQFAKRRSGAERRCQSSGRL